MLTTWNSDEVIKEGLDIVKWWMSKPVQINFVKAGGQSGLLSVMNDPAYATWAPYNRAYLDNYRWQKDVWHIPEFFPLLTEQQEQFDKAITGQVSGEAGSGYGRRVPGQAAARSRPHQVALPLRNGAARIVSGRLPNRKMARAFEARDSRHSDSVRFRNDDLVATSRYDQRAGTAGRSRARSARFPRVDAEPSNDAGPC